MRTYIFGCVSTPFERSTRLPALIFVLLWMGLAGHAAPAAAQTTTVPNLSGLRVFEAEIALRSAGLIRGNTVFESNDIVPKGDIIRSEPPAGTQLPINSSIDLIVSSGPPVVTAEVPDVVGLDDEQAIKLIMLSPFSLVAIENRYDDTVPENVVISQSPAGGTVAPVGTAVFLVVSRGPEPESIVPFVTGLSEAEAVAAIEANGLVPVVVEERLVEVSPADPTVQVMEQNPLPGTLVLFGSVVGLGVAVPAIRMPDFVGSDYQVAFEQLVVQGINLLVEQVDAPGEPHNAVLAQFPAAGSLLPLDQPVRITANTGVESLEISLSPTAQAIACNAGEESQVAFLFGRTTVGSIGSTTCESYQHFGIEGMEALQGATIKSVQLRLHRVSCGPAGAGPMVLRVSPSSTAWTTGVLSWETRPAGSAQFVEYVEPCAVATTIYPDADGVLRDYVQAVIDGVESDYGLVLSAPDSDSLRTYATQVHPDPALRPRLTIQLESNEIDLLWLRTVGSTGMDQAAAVGVGPDGAVHAAGTFEAGVNFAPAPGSYSLGTGANQAAFIAKWDAAGGLLWARKIEGTGGASATSMEVDAAGNVYVAGHFTGVADIDPGLRIRNAGSPGMQTGFVLKLDSAGRFTWAHTFEGTTFFAVAGIALGGNGTVSVAGAFEDFARFGVGPDGEEILATADAGTRDHFVATLNLAGNLQWVATIRCTSAADPTGITVDANGNVYSVGRFGGAADFDPGAGQFARFSAGKSDLFILKLNPSGGFVWARTFGGSESDSATAVAVDAAGHAYVPGWIQGSVDFGPGHGTLSRKTEDLPRKGVLLKLDAAGNLSWVTTLAVVDSQRECVVHAIALANDGIVHVAGFLNRTAPQDETPNQGFLARIGPDGNLFYARLLGGSGDVEIRGLALDGQNALHVAGHFSGTTDFGPVFTNFQQASLGAEDLLLAKFAGSGEVDPPPPLLSGDINRDGVVNAVDVQLVTNAALGIALELGLNADINGDGFVNAVDVQLVINAALGIDIE